MDDLEHAFEEAFRKFFQSPEWKEYVAAFEEMQRTVLDIVTKINERQHPLP